MEWLTEIEIGLASSSPRRSDLMTAAGFNIKIVPSPGDEIYPATLPIEEVPTYLATQKALNAIPYRDQSDLLLAADTVVIYDYKILGKPKDLSEAKEFLQRLSNKEHQVITGVCILWPPFKRIFSVRSTVQIATLADDEIDYYLDQHQVLDKAGAYGIQDWLGICRLNRIEGSYTNIMGLPMTETYNYLKELVTINTPA